MMKKIKNFALGFVLGIIATGFAFLTINPLSNQLTDATLWFQRSDEQKALYLQGFNLAKQAIDDYLADYAGDRPVAVIVDIDETMLDNSPFQAMLIKEGKHYSRDLWNEWVRQARAQALPGAIEFTKYARQNNVEVFYISNRSEINIEHTLKNLKELGFEYADMQHLLLKTTTSDKTERRNKVLKKYNVICYLGDNLGDFDESLVRQSDEYDPNNVFEDSDKFGFQYIVFPNPMYGQWSRFNYPASVTTDEDKALYKIQLLND